MALSVEYIQSLINEIDSQENRDRKRAEYQSFKIYEGELRFYVEERLKIMFPKTYEAYSVMSYSVLKKIVDKKNKAYKQSPLRKLESDGETKAYQEILNQSQFNYHMRKVDKYFNQHKYCLLGIFAEQNLEGKYSYKIIPMAPYVFDVVLDENGNLEAVVLSYPDMEITKGFVSDRLDQKIAEPTPDDDGENIRYVIWTKEDHYSVVVKRGTKVGDKKEIMIEQIEGNEGNVNPYGVMNFVYLPFDYCKNYPIASDLPYKTVEFNALYSIYQTSGTMQVGTLVLKFPSNQQLDVVTSGIFTGFKLPQSSNPEDRDTSAEYISPSPNMSGHKEAIVTNLMTILDEEGLETSYVSNPNQDFASGFDRALAMADVQDIIETNQDTYAMAEQKVYEIIAQMEKNINGNSIFKSKKLTVVYKKPKVLASETETLTNIEKMEQLGVLEPHEKLMLVDPNLTEEEAKEKLIRIRQAKMDLLKEMSEESMEESGDENGGDNRPSNVGAGDFV